MVREYLFLTLFFSYGENLPISFQVCILFIVVRVPECFHALPGASVDRENHWNYKTCLFNWLVPYEMKVKMYGSLYYPYVEKIT